MTPPGIFYAENLFRTLPKLGKASLILIQGKRWVYSHEISQHSNFHSTPADIDFSKQDIEAKNRENNPEKTRIFDSI